MEGHGLMCSGRASVCSVSCCCVVLSGPRLLAIVLCVVDLGMNFNVGLVVGEVE